ELQLVSLKNVVHAKAFQDLVRDQHLRGQRIYIDHKGTIKSIDSSGDERQDLQLVRELRSEDAIKEAIDNWRRPTAATSPTSPDHVNDEEPEDLQGDRLPQTQDGESASRDGQQHQQQQDDNVIPQDDQPHQVQDGNTIPYDDELDQTQVIDNDTTTDPIWISLTTQYRLNEDIAEIFYKTGPINLILTISKLLSGMRVYEAIENGISTITSSFEISNDDPQQS
ncbi:hypothetical protein FOZ60_016322, partial [Perkinsus olseni]